MMCSLPYMISPLGLSSLPCYVLVYMLLTCFVGLGDTQTMIHGSYSRCSQHSYRRLSGKLQHEHQCLMIEQVQKEIRSDKSDRVKEFKDVLKLLGHIDGQLNTIINDIDYLYQVGLGLHKPSEDTLPCGANQVFQPGVDDLPLYKNCEELHTTGEKRHNGVYPIIIPNGHIKMVYCDHSFESGGWTVIQRRVNGEVDFARNWTEYRNGFGNVNHEFWLGNEVLHQMTANQSYSLRVDLWDWDGSHVWAQYLRFRVDNETSHYKLHVGEYQGTAGDSLSYHNGASFSTPERDNDDWFASCAQRDRAGWWYRDCSFSELNGQYYNMDEDERIGPNSLMDGVLWFHWKMEYSYSMKKTEMKIRPLY